MQKTPSPTQASKPTATAEPLYTQALLQQAGALDFSLPNTPSLPVVAQDMVLAMGADEMRRRLLQLSAGEAGRLPQGNASPLDYVSETESEEEPTPHRPAARVQTQDKPGHWEGGQNDGHGWESQKVGEKEMPAARRPSRRMID